MLLSRAKSLRTPSNMLVVTLALFDFIQMLKTPVFIINSFNEGPIFGKLGCQIYGILGAYGGLGSSMTNAAIAFDRYRFHPLFIIQIHVALSSFHKIDPTVPSNPLPTSAADLIQYQSCTIKN